ncbi:DUF2270 domain-containing protein [Tropicimonas isoalkanivorans]|uniref:Uncharacterized membrane protein n=1 Tax=Tropicimonas isoalkanivorans TaxID=441112 RepID=A0A1I1DLK0_9RHOB|nr:DUF2270 domain-containing protein [Tropicimonas isoalkanivorans]SFB73393.1 Uncharacterized membrane protein [Tropicimonas isoalkanivorans]
MSDHSIADPFERKFNAAEIGALAHLYRAEVYRSTVWRTRLDTTTNWSVVSLGVALSISFSSPEASPLPLLIVGTLIWTLLLLEARRYRYFDVWRHRTRFLEVHLYAPVLRKGDLDAEYDALTGFADDYEHPKYHVTFLIAFGRRIRRNYLWILAIQSAAYVGKLVIHPIPAASIGQVIDRADTGPLPGEIVLAFGALYLGLFIAAAWITRRIDRERTARLGRAFG